MKSMNAGSMKSTKYLTKEDCGEKGIQLTIRDIAEEDVDPSETATTMKWVLYFAETQKGLVLNGTNIDRLIQVCRSDDTAQWEGKKVVLFNDPNVEFGGRHVGGIRVWVQPTVPAVAIGADEGPPPAPHSADFKDDIPF